MHHGADFPVEAMDAALVTAWQAVRGVSGRLMIVLDTNFLAHAIHKEEPDDATQWQ